ncbi:MAG: glucosaminidase domain-containing protein [Deltaproteobacteria bacterium]|nr:glucosaminidase domain-containing protein [Deltaproteobacteria bacterium]
MQTHLEKWLNRLLIAGTHMLLIMILAGCDPAPTSTVVTPPAKKDTSVEVSSMKELGQYYDSIGYNIIDNPGILNAIPRLRFTHTPKNWEEERSIPLKKSVFFRTMTTMALEVNEEIQKQRRKLLKLDIREALSTDDLEWLGRMMKKYKVSGKEGPYSPDQMAELHIRIDIIPPSLTLVQSAIESAWGSSRFAREGNALFGQWTTSGKGIKAEKSDARLAAFSSPRESVAAYCLNLNTHPSYSIFRVARAEMRKEGQPLDGAELAMHLEKYSEKGVEYTILVKNMIIRHDLEIADMARLADGPETVIKPIDQPAPPS